MPPMLPKPLGLHVWHFDYWELSSFFVFHAKEPRDAHAAKPYNHLLTGEDERTVKSSDM